MRAFGTQLKAFVEVHYLTVPHSTHFTSVRQLRRVLQWVVQLSHAPVPSAGSESSDVSAARCTPRNSSQASSEAAGTSTSSEAAGGSTSSEAAGGSRRDRIQQQQQQQLENPGCEARKWAPSLTETMCVMSPTDSVYFFAGFEVRIAARITAVYTRLCHIFTCAEHFIVFACACREQLNYLAVEFP